MYDEHELSDEVETNPISPKVGWPFIAGLLVLAIETAATQNWDETNWIASGLVVLYAVVGYLVNDPLRS